MESKEHYYFDISTIIINLSVKAAIKITIKNQGWIVICILSYKSRRTEGWKRMRWEFNGEKFAYLLLYYEMARHSRQ